MTSLAQRPVHRSADDGASSACTAARAHLMAFIDGEADEAVAADVLAHVSGCRACRLSEAAMRQLISAVQRAHVPVLASRRLQLRIAQLFAAQESAVDRGSSVDPASDADATAPRPDAR